MRLGGLQISRILLGTADIARSYLGETLLSGPAQTGAPPLPANLMPAAAAAFDDGAGWTQNGAWSVTGGVATRSSTTNQENLEYNIAIPAGDVIIAYDITASNGNTGLKLSLGSPHLNTGINHNRTGQVAKLVSTDGHGRLRFSASGGWAGDLDNVAVYPVDAIRALPADIYGLWGQSNIVGTGSDGPAIGLDTHHPYIEYLPGSDQPVMGADTQALGAAYDPLQHSTTFNAGVGPGMTFAQGMLNRLSAGRRIVLVACGDPATSLVGPGADWAPGGPSYEAARACTTRALTLCPPGSAIRGILWSQGENDDAPGVGSEYPPAFAAMIGQARADLGVAGLPVVILGPTPESDENGLAAAQATLDALSGDANAMAGVRYVPVATGYAIPGDEGHFTAAGHRQRGTDGAAVMIPAAISAQAPIAASAAAGETSDATGGPATSHAVGLPAEIVPGDLLVCVFANTGLEAALPEAGWTVLESRSQAIDLRGSVFWKIAEAADAAAGSMSVTTATAVRAAFVTHRIAGPGTAPEIATGNDMGTPASPALSPAAGPASTLWLAAAVLEGSVSPGAPAGYAEGTGPGTAVAHTDAAGVSLATAWRVLGAAAETPGAWSGPTGNWVAFTMAARVA